MPQADETETTTQQQGSEKPPQSWDAWLEAQPEDVKSLYEQHTSGLKNTVSATRKERDELAKQVKDLAKNAEKGSDLEKSLTDISAKLEAAERRAAFYEDAGKPGIDCRNPKAAYALAQADGLFDRHGAPDWAAIKAAAPELFGKPTPPGNAGAGTGAPPVTQDMNAFIRRMAGR